MIILDKKGVDTDIFIQKSQLSIQIDTTPEEGELIWNIPNGTKFYNSSFTNIPATLNLEAVDSAYQMFRGCSNLESIDIINTTNVTDMGNMFYFCVSLTTIPQLDTSNVINMYSMFFNCKSLTTIPTIDTSNVTNMKFMFSQCESLTSIPELNTSNVTDMGSMFSYCESLTSIPELDTTNVTDMGSMFSNCTSLTTIPELDCSSVNSISGMFGGCENLINVGGFNDLGKAFTNKNYTFSLYGLVALSKESFLNIINKLYNLNDIGYTSVANITVPQHIYQTLTDEEKAIATNKGWTL